MAGQSGAPALTSLRPISRAVADEICSRPSLVVALAGWSLQMREEGK